jgi:CubicO group peptidase (beta-lactamase class C family)
LRFFGSRARFRRSTRRFVAISRNGRATSAAPLPSARSWTKPRAWMRPRPYYGDSGDVVEQALSLKLVTAPGTKWAYNNVATNLLSGVIRHVSAMSPERFLRQHLFAGLGIRDVFWQVDKHGNNPCYATLEMRGDDVLKIGQMLVGDRPAVGGLDPTKFLHREGRFVAEGPTLIGGHKQDEHKNKAIRCLRRVGIVCCARLCWLRSDTDGNPTLETCGLAAGMEPVWKTNDARFGY